MIFLKDSSSSRQLPHILREAEIFSGLLFYPKLDFYGPNFGEVEGAYWFGPSVRPSVCLSFRNTWQLRNSRTAYARTLKLYMWHVHEKEAGPYFFPPPVLSFWSYAPFSTLYEKPCEQNI